MLILLVEDDAAVRTPLTAFLKAEGFTVLEAASLAEADKHIARKPALIVLDWNLPDGQGADQLKKWRAGGLTTPIILLTARTELVDKVVGLESGAGDYITKPFEPRELLARIRAQLRTAGTPSAAGSNVLQMHGVKLDIQAREVLRDGKRVELARKEFDLLRLLMENPGKVFSRDELLNKVWGFENFPSTRTVDTHILELRNKLGADLFETYRGVGYRMRKPE